MMINATQNHSINNNAVLVNARQNLNVDNKVRENDKLDKSFNSQAAVYEPSTLSDYDKNKLSPLQKTIINIKDQINSLKDDQPLSKQQRDGLVKNLNHYLGILENGGKDDTSGSKPLTPEEKQKQMVQQIVDNYTNLQYQLNNPFSYLPHNQNNNSFFSQYSGNSNIFSVLDRGMDAMQNNDLFFALQSLNNRLDNNNNNNNDNNSNVNNYAEANPFSSLADTIKNDKLSEATKTNIAMATIYHNAMNNLNVSLNTNGKVSASNFNRLA